MEHNREKYIIQSVDHALDVLEAFSATDRPLYVTQLSTQLGLNKSTVFRLLATLQRRGYIEQDLAGHAYRLGLTAFETSRKCLSAMDLLTKARPVLEKLVRQCDEAVYLAVRSRDDLLFLDMADTTQQVKVVSLLGRRFPLAGTAAGKVWRAFAAETGPPDVEQTRQSGYGFGLNDLIPGVATLTAPLFDGEHRLVGALVLVGPEFRLGSTKLRARHVEYVLGGAESISSRLGFRGSHLQAQGA